MKREDFGRFLKTIFFKVTFKNLNSSQARLNNFIKKNIKKKEKYKVKKTHFFKLNFNNDIKEKHERVKSSKRIFLIRKLNNLSKFPNSF